MSVDIRSIHHTITESQVVVNLIGLLWYTQKLNKNFSEFEILKITYWDYKWNTCFGWYKKLIPIFPKTDDNNRNKNQMDFLSRPLASIYALHEPLFSLT